MLHALRPLDAATAPCNMPYKIRDPVAAQRAALSLIRMADLIEEVADAERTIAWHNRIGRGQTERAWPRLAGSS
jgi:nickel superoxide dismutase